MRLVITESYEHSALLAARMMEDVVRENPKALLGLATGSTPEPVYANMVSSAANGQVDFSNVRTINLDEYVGLAPEDPNSYMFYMRRQLFDGCGIPLDHVMIPDGQVDPEREIRRMNEYADSHTIDVQLLSVGVNGHIGFNEPADRFYDKYHLVELTERTRRSNARFFESLDQVPRQAVTMGVGGIMRAKKIVFLATGMEKLRAMRGILEEGDISPSDPGSVLKLHRDCTIFLDIDLAKWIKPAGYVELIKI